jgi:solute:Na+ symporter, SSS family
MEAKLVWLFVFVAAYWSYCIFWGVKGAIAAKTASDYMVAGRALPTWVFVLAATATSFSGWTFVGHPALVFKDGFQYAYASFYAITIPFTGVLFLKRQWMLAKRYGFVTPGEMLATYFQGTGIRVLTVVVALFFSIPYLGVQLRASGVLFNILTDGFLNVNVGMWMLSAVVFIYVASGGLKAVAYVDTMQCLLLAFGITAVGIIGLNQAGGWDALREGIVHMTEGGIRTPDDYSRYIALPGVIQWVSAGGKAVGGAWTGVMILTYMFALMGIQSAPAFSMWAFANKNPKPFAPQQVWASSAGIGFILFVFTAFQAMAGHMLGGDKNLLDKGFAINKFGITKWNEASGLFAQADLVPYTINLMGESTPWLVGLLAVCALAAMQSTGAAYMSTAGSMLTRDLYKYFINPTASHATQLVFGRIGVGIIVGSALIVATFSTDALVLLGGLAVAYGFQMWPSLMSVCWMPWFTRKGVTWGLFAGIVAVSFTETVGLNLIPSLPWGRWPLTMHSAFWGIFFNLGIAIIVSAMTQDEAERKHKMQYHDFLQEHAGLPEAKKGLVPIAWIVTLVWFFFGTGPGAVIGNTIFGNPNIPSEWWFGMPSIWTWQIIWWVIGVGMMWLLAYKMELSLIPKKEFEVLMEDIGDAAVAT